MMVADCEVDFSQKLVLFCIFLLFREEEQQQQQQKRFERTKSVPTMLCSVDDTSRAFVRVTLMRLFS